MSEKPEPQAAAKPIHDLFLELMNSPLYSKVPIFGDNPEAQIKNLRLHHGKFDMYCPGCKKHTTWKTFVLQEALKEKEVGGMGMGRDTVGLGLTGSNSSCFASFAPALITHVADFYFEVAGPNLRERVKYAKDQKEQLEPTNLVKAALRGGQKDCREQHR